MSETTPTAGEQTLTPRIKLPWTAKDADLLNETGGKVAEFLFQQDARFAAATCNAYEDLLESAELAVTFIELLARKEPQAGEIDWPYIARQLRKAVSKAKGGAS